MIQNHRLYARASPPPSPPPEQPEVQGYHLQFPEKGYQALRAQQPPPGYQSRVAQPQLKQYHLDLQGQQKQQVRDTMSRAQAYMYRLVLGRKKESPQKDQKMD